ncbi:hypothetical protein DFH05DRAFT_1304020 [Lentinula detonsa]|uniref:Uncharacterized protein n=1 Tax=Lentinula detonsa TaxID=2804962 RepID=A0A9W8NYD3_9AGAR|nr:hypothetical protein DFH05DRAFT_1304020 [Lentinula detonsa]
MTMYSRSMIQEMGENVAGVEHPPEPQPTVLDPWPLLTLSIPDASTKASENATDAEVEIHCASANAANRHTEGQVNTLLVNHEGEVSGDTDDTAVNSTNGQKITTEEKTDTAHTIDDLSIAEENVLNQNMSTVDYVSLSKLEEDIPEVSFPDIVLVNDPEGITKTEDIYHLKRQTIQEQTKKPLRYKRVWPKLARDSEPSTLFNSDIHSSSVFHQTPTTDEIKQQSNRNIAYLNLSSAPVLGTGHHSIVYRGALQLPSPLSDFSLNPCVSVATKMAFIRGEERELIEQEGRVYNAFPEYLKTSYSGYNLVPPIAHPVPAAACVPKFFGYHVPVNEVNEAKLREADLSALAERRKRRKAAGAKQVNDGDTLDPESEEVAIVDPDEDETEDEKALEEEVNERSHIEERRWQPISPLLLVEECGKDIVASELTRDERNECFTILLRLHHANFIHKSFYVRNFLKQPGPLTKPPQERSISSPSFRLIDFGRTRIWRDEMEEALSIEREDQKNKILKNAAQEWFTDRNYEVGKVFRELEIPNYES